MSDSRISTLEDEVKFLKAALVELRDLTFYEGGKQRMFDNAVLSLLGTHHNPAVLTPILTDHLDKLDANIVNSSQSEAHLKGAQDAADLLRLAPEMFRKP